MELEKHIQVLTVISNVEISEKEIPSFRGAFIHALGEDVDLLFHNHVGDELRYSYPLVQYKRLNGKAAVVCIAEGCDVFIPFMHYLPDSIQLGRRKVQNVEYGISIHSYPVSFLETPIAYRLVKWIPFNSENYAIFQKKESLIEKISFLQEILTGNILSMGKGLNLTIGDWLEIIITDCSPPGMITEKNVRFMTFDLTFKTNLLLPDYIGLGKSVSKGHGILKRITDK